MKLSLKWIGDYVDLSGVDAEALAERLTRVTAEIEGVERRGAGLGDVMTARVLEVARHPKADRLSVCKVDAGTGVIGVVCGAPNVRADAVVAFAPPGTQLPDGKRIERAEIRGVESQGMICSLAELRLGEDADGIWLLPEETPVGRRLGDVLPVEDAIIEIDNKSLTHRPDLWGHYGFAREFAAFLGRKLRPLQLAPFAIGKGPVTVTVDDPIGCPRYLAAVVRGVRVGPSPAWMQLRLQSVDVRPRNNVVDLTNYVMLEIGQPTHAFDLERLHGSEIRIRHARAGEKITTLDKEERKLDEAALVIADSRRAIAVAGVMGGAETEISESTRSVLLESANFEPSIVRKTAQRIQLRTDASSRFEKSLDPDFARQAVGRFLSLLPSVIPGATLDGPVADVFPAPPLEKSIELRLATVHHRLGVDVGPDRVRAILEALEFRLETLEGGFRVSVPSFRATKDVSIEMDLVEEIGRLYGYDDISERSPLIACAPAPKNPMRALEREVKAILSLGLGFHEVGTYSFVDDTVITKAGLDPEHHVHIKNAIASGAGRLRISIVPNLLAILEENLRHRDAFRLYELGRSYTKADRRSAELPVERRDVVGFACRKRGTGVVRPAVFFDAKGACEALLRALSLSSPEWRSTGDIRDPWVHPSRSAELWQGSLRLGEASELHPSIAQAFDLATADVSFFRIDLGLLSKSDRPIRRFEPLPRFPAIRQDLSIVVAESVRAADLEATIREAAPDLIGAVRLFDVYTGAQVGAGKRSLTFEITYRAPDRTLRDSDAAALHARVVARVQALGALVRGV
ncbi:MAG: phenylalanine--tRNA ligase subunit beta [Planctomycetes bacterium]|nr:phenylalanine--tRNA ligase subunit beta [Planctomycetota bacterium]MBI3846774.1 phenylalanine--tRNA ligase subunit beta [Planctomycetota bacterium]